MKNRIIILCMIFSLTAVLSAQQSTIPAKGGTEKTVTTKGKETVKITLSSGEKAAVSEQALDKADSLDPLKYSRPNYDYNSGGKRDPFNSLAPEQVKENMKIKGLFNYDKAALQGIVHADNSRYALVVDSDKFGHVLREGDKVLGGNVTQITDDSVYFHIVKFGRPMTIILRLETAKATSITREAEDIVFRKPGINLSYEKGSTAQRSVSIEEVVIPSPNMKTVDEIWFGSEADKSKETIAEGVNTLFDPPENASISLPHLFRWTKSPGDSLYTLIVSGDRNFESVLLAKEKLRTSSSLLDEESSLPVGETVYWKIVVQHKSGKIVNSRNILSF
ncbi:MAG: hypothetical protein WCU00_11780, partial [Candidatus Latescibacterota bacterium]